jgi:hypothetical protein
VLRAADYLVQWWSGAAATCPDCRWITRLPAYWCSNDRCEAIHRDLRPGRLGVLWHRCRCGAPLSTTVWRASRTLTPACPACDHLLHDAAGVTPDARIALSGGPSAGKTQLLMWAMAAATVAGASPGMWEPADGPTAAWLRDSRDVLANWPDRRPPPTAAPSLLTFRSGSDRDRHYVHFTDIDGKCLLTDTAYPALRQLGTTRRHLLVFDATTFPIVRDKIDPAGLSPEPAESADATAMGIATASAELPYHLLVVQLNRFGARTRRCSLAIVLSRADLTIGDMSFKPDPVGPRSLQVRQWLRIIGMHNLVETAERDFGEVRYFLAGYGIESADPFAPFAWLLNRYSRGPSIP